MNNNNPAEMSNEDLENDMHENSGTVKGNQEGVNKSSAAEGSLKTPEQDEASKSNIKSHYQGDQQHDLDDLVHETTSDDAQDGSMPDPEALDNWESNDEDINKISS